MFHKLFTGLAIPGWASTMITASFFGSLNALGISILGEYVIRIYDQVRNRPVYVAAETRNLRRPRLEIPASAAPLSLNRTPEPASDPSAVPIGPQVDLLLESLERHIRYWKVKKSCHEDYDDRYWLRWLGDRYMLCGKWK